MDETHNVEQNHSDKKLHEYIHLKFKKTNETKLFRILALGGKENQGIRVTNSG